MSVKQPFASAILAGLKTREYRSWYTHHRGPLLIHAGQGIRRDDFADYPQLDPKTAPRGAVLGVVDVADCVEAITDEGAYVYAWILARPRWLTTPIPMKGRLGLFEVEIPAHLMALPCEERRPCMCPREH